MKPQSTQVRLTNAVTRITQLENDVAAAKQRELHLFEENDKLRRDHVLLSNELIKTYRERDDWREAFKTVSKLVK